MNRIVIHYSEIALKGKNRRHFEDALLRHVREALAGLVREVRKRQGRLVCRPEDDADPQQVCEILSRIPGIVNFSLGHSAPKEIAAIGRRAVNLLTGRLSLQSNATGEVYDGGDEYQAEKTPVPASVEVVAGDK